MRPPPRLSTRLTLLLLRLPGPYRSTAIVFWTFPRRVPTKFANSWQLHRKTDAPIRSILFHRHRHCPVAVIVLETQRYLYHAPNTPHTSSGLVPNSVPDPQWFHNWRPNFVPEAEQLCLNSVLLPVTMIYLAVIFSFTFSPGLGLAALLACLKM
jgi:hypothetical protein